MVSVIIPIFNCEKYIKQCIESIINQTYKNIEIILVDDGSTDNSLNICQKYTKDLRVFLYSKENGGVSSARNFGLNCAKGEYILFIDADDFIDSKAIEELVSNTSEQTLVALNYCKTILEKNIFSTYTKYKTEEFVSSVLKGKIHGGICGILLNRKYVEDQRFDENTFFMEDTLFLFKYLKNVNEIKFIKNDQYYHYTENINSITKSKSKALSKIINIIYSLQRIEELLGPDYSELIYEKKVALIEKEMRNYENTKDIREILEYVKHIDYKGNNRRLKVFSKIFNSKKILLIKLYYFIRVISKDLYYRLRRKL